MTITLTKNENGYDLAATGLPAPLTITDAVAKALAGALVSDDIVNPVAAFGGIDKLVWSPQTREPIGLWVTGEAKVQFWIAGQTTDLTKDEAAQLALTVLLAGATHTIGDEVEVVSGYSMDTYENGNENEPYIKAYPGGSLGKITEVYYSDLHQRVAYKVDFNGDLAPHVIDTYIKRPDPIQKFEVIEDGRVYVTRSVVVEARNPTQARQLAVEEFKAMGAQKGWSDGTVETDGIGEITAIDFDGFTDDNAAEGFIATATNGITAYRDADNNSIFEGDDVAAQRFVIAKALAGSPRHRRALKLASGL